jgi:hypothetical protein
LRSFPPVSGDQRLVGAVRCPAVERLDGLDERSLVLDDGWLDVLRWGSSENRFPVAQLGETEIVRDDKKKLFGKGEERIRIRFGAVATAIWLPASEEPAARRFAEAVDAAR